MTRRPARPARDKKPARSPWPAVLGALAVLFGIVRAFHLSWLGDDAFISFRYADNLLHGLGLVYNAGERVEGYSNFLWTMFVALGMKLGARPEAWSVAWGVLFYAATVALLCFRRRAPGNLPRGALGLPLAGIVAAVHGDWNIFATSGLETSSFTFLVTLAYVWAVDAAVAPWAVGVVAALLALSRPDGVAFAPFLLAGTALARPGRGRAAAWFGLAFVAIFVPYVAWKVSYYGDWFPNTYYAKSAGRAWWSQGWLYVGLYFAKYWPLALGVPLAVVAWWRTRGRGGAAAAATSPELEVGLAATMALAFTVYLARVGGDFMFARMLIPVTPLYAIVLEWALRRLAGGNRRAEVAWVAAVGLAIALTPYPFREKLGPGGIAKEREYNTDLDLARAQHEGTVLRRYFDGLPARIAIVGSQARLAYYSRASLVIEAQTGLTDRWLARQPLPKRGRIGHEKIAPMSYLESRGADLVIDRVGRIELDVERDLPVVLIAFDDVPACLLRWDAPLIAQFRQRGAQVVDFPAWLDQNLGARDTLSAANRATFYRHLSTFYFDATGDSVRRRQWAPPGAQASAAVPPGAAGRP